MSDRALIRQVANDVRVGIPSPLAAALLYRFADIVDSLDRRRQIDGLPCVCSGPRTSDAPAPHGYDCSAIRIALTDMDKVLVT